MIEKLKSVVDSNRHFHFKFWERSVVILIKEVMDQENVHRLITVFLPVSKINLTDDINKVKNFA